MTYGTLSSDGRCVFSIEDLALDSGLGAAAMARRFIVRGRVAIGNPADADNEQTSPCNRLAAHEIRTGKLKWQLGGPAGQYALRQAETFFLGPPLPLMGQLYVLAETKGEIRLLALEAATGDCSGRSNWPRRKQNVHVRRICRLRRRWAGASPSYADGILVCPTSAGAIVGVELATRSLLWGYCYSQGSGNNRRNIGMMVIPRRRSCRGTIDALTGSTAAPRSARAACW